MIRYPEFSNGNIHNEERTGRGEGQASLQFKQP